MFVVPSILWYKIDLPLLAIPLSLVGAYQLYRKRRRRRVPLVTTSITSQPQPAVTLQPEEVALEPTPRVFTSLPAKRVVRLPPGGIGRIEVRKESRLRRPTGFRSIADVLMRIKVEEE